MTKTELFLGRKNNLRGAGDLSPPSNYAYGHNHTDCISR